MWRVLLYVVLIGIAAWGAVWLANHPETVAVTWQGREYSTSLAVGVVAIVALAVVISIVVALLGWVANLPRAIGRDRRNRRRTRGLTALSRGIVAVGAGDVTAARRYSAEAERLLGHEPLALLLQAQAAQAAGNRDGAEAAFRRMAQLPDTKVLGLRGLYLEARRRGDAAAARHHAEAAARAAPAVAWANEAVLEGYTADRDWDAAIAHVERRTSLGIVDRKASRRQRAVLLAAKALDLEPHRPDAALAAAQDAVRLAPDLVPSAALAGRLLAERFDITRAAKILEAAWRATPHPDLAAAYLNLRSGDSGQDRIARAETLAKWSGWAPESRLALARAALDARTIGRARDAMAPLLDDAPTVRACLLMAEIEQQDGRPGAVREWLGRATRAARDKAWVADGVVRDTWAPVSPVTGQLDAFGWETPPEELGRPATPALDFLAAAEEPPAEPVPPPAVPAVLPAPEAAREAAHGPATPLTEIVQRPASPAVEAEASVADEPSATSVQAAAPVPERVIFPVPHAPDDPGAERGAGRSSRFRLLG